MHPIAGGPVHVPADRHVARTSPRDGRARRGAAAVELAVIMPVFLLLTLGFVDFGRFAYAYIAVTNAARAGAGAGITSDYPDTDPSTGQALSNWNMKICNAVADELGMSKDFTPTLAGDTPGYINTQGLFVGAQNLAEPGGSGGRR